MLVAAALVPDTALVVPGAAGRATVLADERDAVLRAVAVLVAAEPDRVAVVVPGPDRGGVRVAGGAPPAGGHDRLTLGAAGIDDAVLGWTGPRPPVPGPGRGAPDPAAGSGPARPGVPPRGTTATTVGRLVLAASGWTGAVDVGDAGDASPDAPPWTSAGPGRTALLLVGSLSARRGPHAPLPDDPRAAAVDDAVAADLLDLGPEARRRLTAVPAALADELAISARLPWQHLVAEVERDGRRWRGEQHSLSAPFGATYAVLSWLPEPTSEPVR